MKIVPAEARLRDGRVVGLRSPEASDVAESLVFMRQLAREAWRMLNHPPAFFDGVTAEQQAALFDAVAAHPRSIMILAFDGARVVGSTSMGAAGASVSPHVGELGLGVLAAYAGLGLGRALTEALVAAAATAGVTNLTLRVRTFNERAIRLYERVGFRRVGTLVGVARLPEGDVDEYVYQRLAP
jgi:ribosomal protein S18 acetylase RimI-like enzyme